VYLWSVSSGTLLGTMVDETAAVGATFSPDSSTLAFGDNIGQVYLWNVTSLRGAHT
jgi:WD40 repeat protein